MGRRFQAFRKHFPVGAVALEVFSIVLGVGLALAAGQWMESRREAQRTEESLHALAQEMSSNQKIAVTRLEKRHELDLDLSVAIAPVYMGEPRISIDSLQHVDLGIIPYSTAAYETMLANGTLANLDIDTSVPITRAYTLMETTSAMDAELRQQMTRMDFYDIFVDNMSDPSESANAMRAMLNLIYQLKINDRNLLTGNRRFFRHLSDRGIAVDTLAAPVDSLGLPSPKIQQASQELFERQRAAREANARRIGVQNETSPSPD